MNILDKKKFLNWLVSHETFARREVSWILNYLSNHETILKNVHFIEHSEKTPRGLCIQTSKNNGEPMSLFLEGSVFVDSDQIFHEIRLNWKKPLYLECRFEKSWENQLYLSVLEDNPFYRWNETMDEQMLQRVDEFFNQKNLEAQVAELYQKIDQALEAEDQEAFIKLSNEVNQLLGKNSLPVE